jgi:ABC-type Zn2+ transport system, periplasmic component/surface adhesin
LTVFSTTILIATIIMGNSSLYAHGVLSKEIEAGKIKFSYDDNSPLANGYIDVYDKDGKEIAKGQTNADGVFDFSKYENAGKISVSDVHGHHQTHVIGEQGHSHSGDHSHDHDHSHDRHSGNKQPAIIVVVAILLTVAIVFYCARNKK